MGNAMLKEFKVLLRNETYELGPCPDNMDPIGSKWVYRIKILPNEIPEMYKVRVFSKGYDQIEKVHCFETFH